MRPCGGDAGVVRQGLGLKGGSQGLEPEPAFVPAPSLTKTWKDTAITPPRPSHGAFSS